MIHRHVTAKVKTLEAADVWSYQIISSLSSPQHTRFLTLKLKMASTQSSGHHVTPSVDELKHESDGDGGVVVVTAAGDGSPNGSTTTTQQPPVHIPLRLKITAVLLVSAIGFGAHWSSGVTGAMKSTLKKVP